MKMMLGEVDHRQASLGFSHWLERTLAIGGHNHIILYYCMYVDACESV